VAGETDDPATLNEVEIDEDRPDLNVLLHE